MIDFRTCPEQYKHWQLTFDGPVATLSMDVDAASTLFDGYELKLNSYDLGVDIELYDAIQRLRFEHPEVKTVILRSGKEGVFCAGANIRMLGGASHGHKVNFCKFTNETRNSIEDASEFSGQRYLCAARGTAAGGGYELALACDHILMADDGNSTVSLPEVPLLAVLPGTGGLTRVVDKRKVRRDHADIFSTTEEGIGGQRAVDWRLVDEIAPGSKFEEAVQVRALEMAGTSDRPDGVEGVSLTPLERHMGEDSLTYEYVRVQIDRSARRATLIISSPDTVPAGMNLEEAITQGSNFWPLAVCRELDDAMLHLRLNEEQIGLWVFKTEGHRDVVESYDEFVLKNNRNWFMRELALYWRRTLKRVDLTSRTLVTFVEPGSCFVGVLAELMFAADRIYMLDGQFEGDDRPAASVRLTEANFGTYTMSNGLTRLQTRFFGEPESVEKCTAVQSSDLDANACMELGVVTEAIDDIDWEDEMRVMLEERSSFSPDALTGMEANLRFVGPETMETKIFGRLTAWQNWIFQRPNAVADEGALRLYGTGSRPSYDMKRV